jgi:hypothetical protein
MATNMLFDKQEAPSGLVIACQNITVRWKVGLVDTSGTTPTALAMSSQPDSNHQSCVQSQRRTGKGHAQSLLW